MHDAADGGDRPVVSEDASPAAELEVGGGRAPAPAGVGEGPEGGARRGRAPGAEAGSVLRSLPGLRRTGRALPDAQSG